LGNHQTGVQVLSHATNTAIVNNVISSNFFWGIELASATDTSISGNKIGTGWRKPETLPKHTLQTRAGASS